MASLLSLPVWCEQGSFLVFITSLVLPLLLALCLWSSSSSGAKLLPHDAEGRVLPCSKRRHLWVDHTFVFAANDHRLLDIYMEMAEEAQRKTWWFRVVGQPPHTVVMDPKCIEYILRENHTNFPRGPVWERIMGGVVGPGVFTSEGIAWSHPRRIISRLFQLDNFRAGAMETLDDKTSQLLGCLGEAAGNGSEVDMQDLFNRYTLDTIALFACGVDLDCLSRGDDSRHFRDAITYLVAFLRWLFLVPGPLYWPTIYMTPWGWKYLYNIHVIRDGARRQVLEQRSRQERTEQGSGRPIHQQQEEEEDDKHSQGQQEGGEQQGNDEPGGKGQEEAGGQMNDLVSLLMAHTDENGKAFTDSYLTNAIMVMLIAGRDTSGAALTWSIYCLCKHPNVLQRVRDEALSVLGDPDKDAKTLRYEDLSKLRYLEAFMTEVLRLYPSVPYNSRWVVQDDVLPDGTRVFANTSICIAPYGIHRMPEVWPNPLRFDPNRHLTTKPSSFKFLAYLAGPHTCLGLSLANMEIKHALAHLVLHYDFELVRQDVKPIHSSLSLLVDGGLPVRVIPRSRVAKKQAGHQ